MPIGLGLFCAYQIYVWCLSFWFKKKMKYAAELNASIFKHIYKFWKVFAGSKWQFRKCTSKCNESFLLLNWILFFYTFSRWIGCDTFSFLLLIAYYAYVIVSQTEYFSKHSYVKIPVQIMWNVAYYFY